MQSWVVGAVTMALITGCGVQADQPSPRATELVGVLASHGGTDAFLLPDSDDFARIPQDPRNELTAEKVELGQLLYHETGLADAPKSADLGDTYSCASCHHAKAGFQAGIRQGIGEGGLGFGAARVHDMRRDLATMDIQQIRTPSTLNIAYQGNVLWNGQFGAHHLNKGTEGQWEEGTPLAANKLGFHGVETQAIAGMGVHRLDIGDEGDGGCAAMVPYSSRFDSVFIDVAEDERYTNVTTGLAIAAYERTLLANQAPFQRFLRGEMDALDEESLAGALLFFGKADCVSCHSGPALASMSFHALGMPDLSGADVVGPDPDDKTRRGRGGFTGRFDDDYKFKTPQLYNLRDSPFYGHGGNFNTVREVIAYKNAAVPAQPEVPATQLAEEFRPLGLTEREIDQLTAFIERGLHDPNLERYVPKALPSGLCFPVADGPAQSQLDCANAKPTSIGF